MAQFFSNHSTAETLTLVAAVAVAAALLSMAGAISVLVLLPQDYFANAEAPRLWAHHHPVVRLGLHALKNLIGLLFVAVGVLLALPGVPGQGFLTILTGLLLIDFPGKYRLERRVIAYPKVQRTVNRLRARFHRPPLVMQAPPAGRGRSDDVGLAKSPR